MKQIKCVLSLQTPQRANNNVVFVHLALVFHQVVPYKRSFFLFFSPFTNKREGFWWAGFSFCLCLRAKSSMNIIFHSTSFACLSTRAVTLVGYSNITNKINMSKFRSTNKLICDTNFAWQIILLVSLRASISCGFKANSS